jgi:hypothetical protein
MDFSSFIRISEYGPLARGNAPRAGRAMAMATDSERLHERIRLKSDLPPFALIELSA